MREAVLLETVKREHEERIRQAERYRLYLAARRRNERPSLLKSLLLALVRN